MVKKIIDRWLESYAARVHVMRSSAARDLMSTASRPDVISFAGGMPAEESLDRLAFEEAVARVAKNSAGRAFQYGPTEGFYEVRELVCQLMRRAGLNAHPDEVIITAGAQQALDLIAKTFIDEGSEIIIEAPSYVGALNAFRVFQPQVISVEVEADGIKVDSLENTVQAKSIPPRFIYLIPNFQNPAGVTISLEKRKKIAALASEYNVLIIEDNPYGELSFEGKHLPCLRSLCDNVIYLGSLSKIISPGLRVGWVYAPVPILQKINLTKQGADLCSSSLSQLVALEYLSLIDLDEHLKKVRKLYRERCEAMLKALEEFFPEEASWTKPSGGFFIWVNVDAEIDTGDMLSLALEKRVAYIPGSSFYYESGGQKAMRLSFSNPTPEQIYEGIEKLAGVLKKQIALSKSIYGL
jgi:2-aminoadipate transaminase